MKNFCIQQNKIGYFARLFYPNYKYSLLTNDIFRKLTNYSNEPLNKNFKISE